MKIVLVSPEVLIGVKKDFTLKVMLSYPPFRTKGSPMLTQNRQFQWYHVPSFIYPVVMASAATLLKKAGHEVIWNDAIAEGWEMDRYLSFIRREKPDLIVFESKTPVIKLHWDLIRNLKSLITDDWPLITALVGDHVTALPRESMVKSPVDFVLTGGDYDFLLRSLCEQISSHGLHAPCPMPHVLEAGIWYRRNAEIKNTGPFELNHDLNTLPFTDRKLTKAHLYGEKWKKRLPFFYIMSGRDCPWHKCSFCAWTVLYPLFRVRSAENVLDEIGYLIEEHGVREIFDDTGTFPGGRWLEEFCRGMIERGYHEKILFSCNTRFDYLRDAKLPVLMKKAGFRKIKAGLESAQQETLDKINKGTRVSDIVTGCRNAARAGLDVHLTVMVGYPWETRKEVEKTIALARKLMAEGNAEMLQSTVVVPYPGTELHRQALREKWFRIDPSEYERYDMTETVLKTPGLTSEEIIRMSSRVYSSFLQPRFIIRRLSKIRSWHDIHYILKGAKAVIGHLRDFVPDRKPRGDNKVGKPVREKPNKLAAVLGKAHYLRYRIKGWDTFRKKRIRYFMREIVQGDSGYILNLGYGGGQFESELEKMGYPNPIVSLDILPRNTDRSGNIAYFVVADAARLCFKNNSFSAVHCNSVLEHVGGLQRQQDLISEAGRVSKKVFIQTPNKHFILETHHLVPFFQYLPEKVREWIGTNILGHYEKTWLLSIKVIRGIIPPRMRIIKEKIGFFFTKSFYLIKD